MVGLRVRKGYGINTWPTDLLDFLTYNLFFTKPSDLQCSDCGSVLTGDVVEDWLSTLRNRRTLLYCDSCGQEFEVPSESR